MKLTPERVRAMLEAATPGPWTWRSDDIDGCHVVEDPRARYEEETRLAETFRESTADIVLMAAAPDLAVDLLDAHAALATERERAETAEKALATLAKIVGPRLPAAQRWLLEQVRRGTDMETPLHKSGEVTIAGLCSRGQTIAALVRAGLVEVGGFCAEVDGDGFTARDDATWYAITPAGRAALAGCP